METFHDQTGSASSAEVEDAPALEDFLPHVGETFVVALPQGATDMELVEAKTLPSHPGTAYEDAFSLVFRAAPDCSFTDGSVAVDHEQVGWVVLFLTRIGEDEQGRYFQAVFL